MQFSSLLLTLLPCLQPLSSLLILVMFLLLARIIPELFGYKKANELE